MSRIFLYWKVCSLISLKLSLILRKSRGRLWLFPIINMWTVASTLIFYNVPSIILGTNNINPYDFIVPQTKETHIFHVIYIFLLSRFFSQEFSSPTTTSELIREYKVYLTSFFEKLVCKILQLSDIIYIYFESLDPLEIIYKTQCVEVPLNSCRTDPVVIEFFVSTIPSLTLTKQHSFPLNF